MPVFQLTLFLITKLAISLCKRASRDFHLRLIDDSGEYLARGIKMFLLLLIPASCKLTNNLRIHSFESQKIHARVQNKSITIASDRIKAVNVLTYSRNSLRTHVTRKAKQEENFRFHLPFPLMSPCFSYSSVCKRR